MTKLIDKYEAIAAVQDTAKVIEHMDSVQDGEVKRTARAVTRILEGLPPIEAKPVRHGKWMFNAPWYKCSECGAERLYAERYCPNCGADMR